MPSARERRTKYPFLTTFPENNYASQEFRRKHASSRATERFARGVCAMLEKFVGRLRITEMEQWIQNFIDTVDRQQTARIGTAGHRKRWHSSGTSANVLL